MVWATNATPRPLRPREKAGTHCTEGWVWTQGRCGLVWRRRRLTARVFQHRTDQTEASQILFVCFGRNSPPSPQWARPSSFTQLLYHTQGHTTVGRTPLDERSAHRRGLYLTTHSTHSRQISLPPVGFEPAIPAGERPQTYALDRAATGTGKIRLYCTEF